LAIASRRARRSGGAYGLKDFAGAEEQLREWAAARPWTSGHGPKAHVSDLERWRKGPPRRASGPSMVKALDQPDADDEED